MFAPPGALAFFLAPSFLKPVVSGELILSYDYEETLVMCENEANDQRNYRSGSVCEPNPFPTPFKDEAKRSQPGAFSD